MYSTVFHDEFAVTLNDADQKNPTAERMIVDHGFLAVRKPIAGAE